MQMKGFCFLHVFALLFAAMPSFARIDMGNMGNPVGQYSIPVNGCGGIAYLGGDDYLILQDHDETTGKAMVYPATIRVDRNTGAITSYSFGAGIPLDGNADSEGIACDLCSGGIWVSDETGPTIKEFQLNSDGTAYECSRTAPVPDIYKTIRGNKGLEALAVSCDGLTMWTANEEALEGDGPASAYKVQTVVRLTKFTRMSVHDNWTVAGQWPYRCAPGGSSLSTSYCGLSGLCALPDGSLLSLEREVSTSTAGSCLIYQISADKIAAATSILDVPTLADREFTCVEKEKVGSFSAGGHWKEMIVYEGICLGPKLNNGHFSLILVSDGGATASAGGETAITVSRLCALDCYNMGEYETVDFAKPSVGTSSIVGSNYRFMKNAPLSVMLSDASAGSPYVVDGTPLAECSGWQFTGAATSETGSGKVANFTVSSDGVFSWNVEQKPAVSGYHVVDSFEGFAAGTPAASINGWSGEECFVIAQSYTPPTPPGYVMTHETHTKVLDAEEDDVVRNIPSSVQGTDKIDVMICARRSASELETLLDDIQIQVASDPQGRLCVWHSYEENGEWKRGWIPLSETVYADGEWVRLGIELDYTSNPSGDAFAKVTVNGSCQPTVHGVRSPTDLRAYGPWHYLAKNRRTGGVSMPSEIGFSGTKVDDLMLCKKSVTPEHTGVTSVDGIEFSWFDNAGLPRNPLAAAPFIPGYTLGDVYTAGLDPYSDRPFKVTGFELDADGRPHIEFNGYKGETPVGYRVLYSSTPDFKNATALGTSDGAFDGDAATWSTVWEGKSDAPTGAGFYKVEAIR